MSPLPSAQELSELRAIKREYCLTIYLKSNSLNQRNALVIELKNHLQQAKNILVSQGLSEMKINKITGPINELVQLNQYWPKLGYNLVIFAEADFFQYYYLREGSFDDQIVLANSFELGPLEEILNNNPQYYVLELSHKNIHLLEGDRYQLKEVHLKDLPNNMEKDLKIDEFPKSRQSHTIGPVRSTDSQAFHQQYDVHQTDKKLLKEFFSLIDSKLHRFLFFKQKPLILAGVSYLIPIYKSVNSYPGLREQYIGGNQSRTNKDLLRQKALSVLD